MDWVEGLGPNQPAAEQLSKAAERALLHMCGWLGLTMPPSALDTNKPALTDWEVSAIQTDTLCELLHVYAPMFPQHVDWLAAAEERGAARPVRSPLNAALCEVRGSVGSDSDGEGEKESDDDNERGGSHSGSSATADGTSSDYSEEEGWRASRSTHRPWQPQPQPSAHVTASPLRGARVLSEVYQNNSGRVHL